MKRIRILRALWIGLFFILIPTPRAHAGDCKQAGGFVIASDRAPILGGDTEQAKNEAVWGAMRRALECKGIIVNGESFLSKGMLLSDSTWVLEDGFIKAWELIPGQSGVFGKGYRATIKAWVKSGREYDKEKRDILGLRKVLFIANNKAERDVETALAAELERLFLNNRESDLKDVLRMHDSDYVRHNVSRTVWRELCNRELYNLDDSAFKFGADLVIHITASAESVGPSDSFQGLDKYDGNAVVRLFQLSGERKGESIVEASTHSGRIFVRHRSNAAIEQRLLYDGDHPNGFKRQVAIPVADRFMQRLMNCPLFAVPDRAVTVVIHDIPSPAAYQKFLYIVKKQRGVMDRVTETSQQGDTYTLQVRFPMKSIYLARMIAQDSPYKIVGRGWNRIEFDYQGGSEHQ